MRASDRGVLAGREQADLLRGAPFQAAARVDAADIGLARCREGERLAEQDRVDALGEQAGRPRRRPR